MRPNDRPYRSVRKATLHHKPMHEVVQWIESYCRVLFPGNGLDYWTCDYRLSNASTSMQDLIDEFKAQTKSRWQIVCYVYDGTSEGTRIALSIVSGTSIKCLASAKSFGPMDECWAIARAVYHAFEGILTWDEEPIIMDLVPMVPRLRGCTYENDAALAGPLKAQRDENQLSIFTGTQIISQHLLVDDIDAAAAQVQHLLHDWRLVAKAFACDSSGLDFETTGFTLSAVAFDAAPDGTAIPAYLNNKRWNGWHMPYFPESSMAEVMAVCSDVRYDAENDAYIIDHEESGEEPDVIPAVKILLKDGRTMKSYPVGAGQWTWYETTPQSK